MPNVLMRQTGAGWVRATLAIDSEVEGEDLHIIFNDEQLPQDIPLAPNDYILGFQAWGNSGADVIVAAVDDNDPSHALNSKKVTLDKGNYPVKSKPQNLRFTVNAGLMLSDLKKSKSSSWFDPHGDKKKASKRKGK